MIPVKEEFELTDAYLLVPVKSLDVVRDAADETEIFRNEERLKHELAHLFGSKFSYLQMFLIRGLGLKKGGRPYGGAEFYVVLKKT